MQLAHVDRFRVAARPVTFVASTEVIIEDVAGRMHLLDWDQSQLSELSPADLVSLGTFFEASQDCTWHTLAELCAILYDAFPTASVQSRMLAVSLADADSFSFGAAEFGGSDRP
jgi:hypothetical protein